MDSWQRFSPIPWTASSMCWPFLVLFKSFLISCSLICPSFLLVAEPFEFYLGIHCLCILIPMYSLLFSCTSFKVWGLILRSLIHFELIVVQSERHRSSFSFPHADIQFFSNICWRSCLFSIICFCYLYQKSSGHSCGYSYLGLLLYSTCLHVCFCANTMLLWICSIVS
jgi:hypothetical protein